jgi:hypothetical protein
MRTRKLVSGLLLLGAAIAAAPAERAMTYEGDHLLFVAYQSQGREFIADLGPIQPYLKATGPVPIRQVRMADLLAAFGAVPPEGLNLAVVAADGPDGYIASVGRDGVPAAGVTAVGSAIGASSQIRALGGNVEGLAAPLPGNDSAGLFEYGDAGSYQATLDAAAPGSLGGNVPFSVETAWTGSTLTLAVVQARFNPYTGAADTPSEIGRLSVSADGSLTWIPAPRHADRTRPGGKGKTL